MRISLLRFGAKQSRVSILSTPTYYTSHRPRTTIDSEVFRPFTLNKIQYSICTSKKTTLSVHGDFYTADKQDDGSWHTWHSGFNSTDQEHIADPAHEQEHARKGAQKDDAQEDLGDSWEGYVEEPIEPSIINLISCLDTKGESITDAKLRVARALQREQPYALLSAVSKASSEAGFIGSIPETAFIDILRLLDPANFLGELKHVHRDIQLYDNNIYGQYPIHHIQPTFDGYMRVVRQLLSRRVKDGCKLKLEEYKFLLKALAHVGDADSALFTWRSLKEANVSPDLDCYNYFNEAKCWSNAYQAKERRRLRVVPWITQLRHPWHRKRLPGYTVGKGGLKARVSKEFVSMIESGIMADVKAFTLLMTALAKEGDLSGAKSILVQVWDVNVDALADADEDPAKPNGLQRGSALYPNEELLWTLAHIFGSNNDIPSALRAVDYVSRRYSIPISAYVWDHLLEWTFVLATPRTNRIKNDGWSGNATGQLPLRSFESLWTTMTSEPYNVKPNLSMYNRFIKNLCHRNVLDAALGLIFQSMPMYSIKHEQLPTYREITGAQSKSSLSNALTMSRADTRPLYGKWDGSQEQRQYEEASLRLQCYRDFLFCQRWFRLLLGCKRWGSEIDRILLWQRQKLPDMVLYFWNFRPLEHISYDIQNGHVEIWTERIPREEKFLAFYNMMREHYTVKYPKK